MRRVSLLGAGWLGLSLGEKMRAEGWIVHAATTTPDRISVLRDRGFLPHVLVAPDQLQDAVFWQSDVLVLTLPFRRSFTDPWIYCEQINAVLGQVPSGCRIVFTSSTSYYPECDHEVSEGLLFSPVAPRLRVLAAVEQRILDRDGVVLRLAGLYGPGRDIGSFSARGLSRRALDTVVNLVHREDVVAVIQALLSGTWYGGEVFNVVSDGHPTRQQLYFGQTKNTCVPRGKSVSNFKLKMAIPYTFCYPNPENTSEYL